MHDPNTVYHVSQENSYVYKHKRINVHAHTNMGVTRVPKKKISVYSYQDHVFLCTQSDICSTVSQNYQYSFFCHRYTSMRTLGIANITMNMSECVCCPVNLLSQYPLQSSDLLHVDFPLGCNIWRLCYMY